MVTNYRPVVRYVWSAAEQLARHYSFRDVVNAAVYQNLEDLGADRFVIKKQMIGTKTRCDDFAQGLCNL